jgi:hypothetical protein
MIPVTVNQLLRWAENAYLERILWIDHGGSGCYSIDITCKTALPIFWTKTALDFAFSEGKLAVEPPETMMWIRPDESLTPSQRKQRDTAWSIIKPLVLQQPDIFAADLRGQLIDRTMKECGITKQTIYRYLRRYWQRGMTPNALLPDYHLCGAAGKEKPQTDKKRGRPRIYGDTAGINVDIETRKRISTVITSEFSSNRKMNLADAYHKLLDRYYSVSGLDEDTGQQHISYLLDHPTLTQFRYWFEKDSDIFRIERTRRTPRVYDKDMRAILGTSTSEVFGPGSRFQIDATIADVFLVSRYDRNKIVGRPVLYVIIDVFSRMVVGLYAGFEAPSWTGAMMALANTTADKVELCHQYGIEIRPPDWPCQSLPNILLSDGGETAGHAAETLINTFRVDIETAAPFRADWKGIVEQQFHLIHTKLGPHVPGFIQSDYQQRGGHDYRLDAVLDIDQFTYIILCCVLTHNNLHECRDYHLDRDMVADDVKPVPIDLWEWGVQRRSGQLRQYPHALVKSSLLPADTAVVTASGISFYDCFYSCRKAMEEHWFERARQRGTWKIRISYDPRCMDTIYLHDKLESFIPCSLTERSRDFLAMTLPEIDQIRKLKRTMSADHAPAELVGRLNLTRDIKAKVEEAKAMKMEQPAPTSSKRARTACISANRIEEKESLRIREAFHPATQPESPGIILPFSGNKSDEKKFPLSEVTPSLLKFQQETSNDES